jgi:hypothetical protein
MRVESAYFDLSQVYIPSNGSYPLNPPLALLRCPSVLKGCPYLLSLQKALWLTSIEKIQEANGENGIIYQLEAFIDDWIEDLRQSGNPFDRNIFDPILEIINGEINPVDYRCESMLHQSCTKIAAAPAPPLRKKDSSHSFWNQRISSPQSPHESSKERVNIRKSLPAWRVKSSFLELIQENLVSYPQNLPSP